MRPASALLAISLCFGAGVGLAPALQTAHACSCAWGESRDLVLVEVAGALADETRLAEESAAWPTTASISTSSPHPLDLTLDAQRYLQLEVAP